MCLFFFVCVMFSSMSGLGACEDFPGRGMVEGGLLWNVGGGTERRLENECEINIVASKVTRKCAETGQNGSQERRRVVSSGVMIRRATKVTVELAKFSLLCRDHGMVNTTQTIP